MSEDALESNCRFEADGDVGTITIPLNCEPVRVRVTLTIFNDTMDPDQITQLLDLRPTRSYLKGEIVAPSSVPRTKSLWSLSSITLESESNVNAHLLYLLGQLVNKEGILKQLQDQGYKINLVCRLGIAHWNTCYKLDCDTISRLACLKIPILFDIFDEQSDDD